MFHFKLPDAIKVRVIILIFIPCCHIFLLSQCDCASSFLQLRDPFISMVPGRCREHWGGLRGISTHLTLSVIGTALQAVR